jgi:hypothetical protein
MKSSYHILLFFLLGSHLLISQSLTNILEVAEQSKATKNYYDALYKYKEALEFDPHDVTILYKAAESARGLKAYKLSAEYYDSVLTHEKNDLYPNTAFYLGQMRQIQGDYAKAILAYNVYLTEHSGEDPNLLAIAAKEIKACEWAREQVNNPSKGVGVSILSNNINSPNSDFAPLLYNNELFYSSNRFDNTASEYVPKRLVTAILTSQNEGVPNRLLPDTFVQAGLSLAYTTFNHNHTKVYYTICEDINDNDKRCDIYVSDVDANNKWSKGIKLPNPINISEFSSTQPNLTYLADQKQEILYFASNRPGGKGEHDIWYTIVDTLGNYSEPVNCADINTNRQDYSPFYHAKTKTLYFSSEGHLGMGGLDVYSSKKSNDRWTTPKNLGVPINSSFDDVFFTVTDRDTLAYLASNRIGTQFLDDATEACCLDLFRVKLQPCEILLDALVYNYYTKAEILGATVTLYDLDQPNLAPLIITNDSSNKFNYTILCDKNYKVTASKKGYTSDSVTFFSGQPGEFPTITKKLFLKPTKANLDVLTFNKNTGNPLNGVTVTLIDLDDPAKTPVVITNPNSNLSQFGIIPCHKYSLTGTKPEFAPATLDFLVDCGTDGTITQKLYLPTILFSFLPVSLFFDNDYPNPATTSTSTRLTYTNTYNAYYKKKDLFNKNYKLISDNRPDSLKNSMSDFFETEVKYGHDKFNRFLAVLEKDLIKGKVYEIFVKGYASPLAKTNYNYNLSQRRIVSVYNEFYKYKNGILKKYVKNGQLKLSQKPFGEVTAPSGISDNKQDLRSIFTVEASRERRVEIIEIKE